MSQIVEDVLKIAAGEVGVHEVGGNNEGPEVEQFQSSVDIPPGSPWCAAFVHWCLKKAGVPAEPATGDTWAVRDWAHSKDILYNDRVHGASLPVRGDIFLLLDANGNPEHTGFVTGDNGNGTFSTIEGNTTDPSLREPDGVYRKTRYVSSASFVRWEKAMAIPALPYAAKGKAKPSK